MLSGSSASKSTYSPRNMRWRSLVGTAGGVVGGMEGGRSCPDNDRAVSIGLRGGLSSSELEGSMRLRRRLGATALGPRLGSAGAPSAEGMEMLSSSAAGGGAEAPYSMVCCDACSRVSKPSRLLSTSEWTPCAPVVAAIVLIRFLGVPAAKAHCRLARCSRQSGGAWPWRCDSLWLRGCGCSGAV